MRDYNIMSGMLSPEKPKEVDEGEVSADVNRQREAAMRRSRVDQNTTVAGASSKKAELFRQTLGR